MSAQDDESMSKNSQSSESNSASAGGAHSASQKGSHFTENQSFVDELNVKDLRQPLRDSRGKVFSAAGRNAPVAEFTSDFLVLHPPQLPYQDVENAPAEEIVLQMDESGVLVDQWGERKRIAGAKFNGKPLYYYWEQKPGTLRHYAVFFDDQGHHHFLTVEDDRVTVDIIYKLRNMTHDGELTRFKELKAD